MIDLAHVTVDVIADARRSDGVYSVLDVRAPAGATTPRHVHRGHATALHLVSGILEVAFDDRVPLLVQGRPVALPEGRPVTLRAVEDVRLLALVVPAASGALLAAALEPGGLLDDRVALLAAAGVTLLAPRR